MSCAMLDCVTNACAAPAQYPKLANRMGVPRAGGVQAVSPHQHCCLGPKPAPAALGPSADPGPLTVPAMRKPLPVQTSTDRLKKSKPATYCSSLEIQRSITGLPFLSDKEWHEKYW